MSEMERCLTEKAGLLRGMLAETKRMGVLLTGRDVEGLGSAVSARKNCIGKIDELDRRIKLCGAAAPGNPENTLLQEIRSLLGEIIEADSANMKAAGDITSELMHGIREVNESRNMLKYNPVMAAGSRFVDREG